MLRRIDGLLAAALVAALFGVAAWLDEPARLAGTVRVIDGDTIEMAGRRVRLAGIDAPELGQTCGPPERPERCGEAARAELRRLVAGGPVTCRLSGRDKWGRDLGVCLVDDRDLGAVLVRTGAAVAYGRYAREEEEARGAGRGVWAGPFERPSAWRAAHRS